MRRTVVTGLGVLSPLGSDLGVVWDALQEGKSGIGRIQKFDCTGFTTQIAGEVSGFDADEIMPKKEQRRMDLFCCFGIGAAVKAVADSGLDVEKEDPERMGTIVGSGVGGLASMEKQHSILMNSGPTRCSPFMIPQLITNMAGGLIAIRFNLKGPNYCTVTACASSAHAIGMAMRSIKCGETDVMLAGGAESTVTPLGVAGFNAMRAISARNDEPEKASRPFDKDRDGFVMADGATILVLEELEHAKARGADIYCEVAGFGMTCDAYHITAPDEKGEGAARAMKIAMNESGVSPDKVGYVNAHGTSTTLNDKVETAAIKAALGESSGTVMVSSSKSMTGHLLGAAGGFEAGVCALAIRDGIIPPTINYDTPDPACDLDYVPNQAREKKVDVCLSNSLGFGGHNACLALKRL